MNKTDKLTNLEVARVLLIQAQDLIRVAVDKIQEVDNRLISEIEVTDGVIDATCVVIFLQNKLKGKS